MNAFMNGRMDGWLKEIKFTGNLPCFTQLFLLVDWLVADLLAIRQGSLGSIRYVLKNGLRYLPLYGFYFAQVLAMKLKMF